MKYSYIFKIISKKHIFICNRNSDNFKQLFYDKYVRFWEARELYSMYLNNDDYLEILEELPLDNENHRHQMTLNKIKKDYVDKLSITEIEDKEISNKLFNNYIKNYRQKYKNHYSKFKEALNNIKCLDNKIYEYAKKIYFCNNKEIYNYKFIDVWNDNRLNDEQKVIYIILRDYLKNRNNNKCKYPFDKHAIKTTIKNLIFNYKTDYCLKSKCKINNLDKYNVSFYRDSYMIKKCLLTGFGL